MKGERRRKNRGKLPSNARKRNANKRLFHDLMPARYIPHSLSRPLRSAPRDPLGPGPLSTTHYFLFAPLFASRASTTACAASLVLSWSIHVSNPEPSLFAVVSLMYLPAGGSVL